MHRFSFLVLILLGLFLGPFSSTSIAQSSEGQLDADQGPTFRLGMSMVTAVFVPLEGAPPVWGGTGFGGGMSLRVGAQIDRVWSIYGQFGAILGSAEVSSPRGDRELVATFNPGIFGAAMLADSFEIGLGVTAFPWLEIHANEEWTWIHGALSARMTFIIPIEKHNPEVGGGPSISAEVHYAFANLMVVTLGAGFDFY